MTVYDLIQLLNTLPPQTIAATANECDGYDEVKTVELCYGLPCKNPHYFDSVPPGDGTQKVPLAVLMAHEVNWATDKFD